MHQARNWAHRTVTDVGGRTGNGARSGNAAEYRGQNVGDSLAEKFRVGAVLGRGHTVSHHRRKQGLDGTQHGDGQGRLEHLLHHFETNIGKVGHRESAGNMVFHADGHHAMTVHWVVPAQHLNKDRGHHDGHQGARNLGGDFRPQDTYGQGYQANDNRIYIYRVKGGCVKLDLANGIGRVLGQETQTKEIGHLAQSDDDGDTRRKAHGHRVGDKLDNGAKLSQTKNHQKDTRQQSGRGKAVVAVLAYDTVDNHDESASRPANLETGAAQEGNGKARDDGRVKPLLGTHARGDGEGDGQGERQDAHDKPGHQVAGKLLAGIAPPYNTGKFRGNRRLDARQETLNRFLGMNIGHRALRSKERRQI